MCAGRVGIEAHERALAAAYPGRVQGIGQPVQTYMRDDALIAHLGKKNELAVLKFKTWLERSVALPGQRVRQGRLRSVGCANGLL